MNTIFIVRLLFLLLLNIFLCFADKDEILPKLNSENFSSTTNSFYDKSSIIRHDALFESWMEFVKIRSSQSTIFNENFPVDERLYTNLKSCGSTHLTTIEQKEFESVDTLEPSMFEIYAEIGHLSKFCATENPPLYSTLEKHDFFRSIVHNGSILNMFSELDLRKLAEAFSKRCITSLQNASRRPSLARILRVLGASRLEVFETPVTYGNLQEWTQNIVRLILRDKNYKIRWKFILLAPGLFDTKIGEITSKIVDDVTQSIELIYHKLPYRTFVVVLRDAGLNFWHSIGRSFSFCQKMHSLWRYNLTDSIEKWRLLETRIEKNYQNHENFYVKIVDMLEGAIPVHSSEGPDISVLSADCVHFSSRGLALLHTHLWNRLVQPLHYKRHHSHNNSPQRQYNLIPKNRLNQHHKILKAKINKSDNDIIGNDYVFSSYVHKHISETNSEDERIHSSDPTSPKVFLPLPNQHRSHSINSEVWIPLVRALFCPRPKCPYMITQRNRHFCARLSKIRYTSDMIKAKITSNEYYNSWNAQPTLLVLLALCVTLYGTLTLIIFCFK